MSQPASPRQLMKLAGNAFEKGKAREAVQHCTQVLQLNPRHAKALHMLGQIHHAAADYDAAGSFYQQAITADPQQIESYVLLTKVLEAKDLANEAVQIANQATKIAPDSVDAHCALVSLFLRFNHAHLVPDYVENLPPRLRESAELMQYYSISLKFNERREEADAIYDAMLKKHRVPASFRIMYESVLPRFSVSREEIEQVREQFAASLARFIREKPQVNLTMLSYHPLFPLAFHNKDNKELNAQYTNMLRLVAPELNYTAPHCLKPKPGWPLDRPIRIGYVSRHMHNHAVGNCYRNIMVHLAKQPDFKVTLFLLESLVDEKMRAVSDAGVDIVPLPKNIPACQQRIATYELDILIYPDIGMDAKTHYLAMARLAHYQCCLPGHPDTTGIDTIDYYLSSRSYEPEDGQKNYTETLLRSPGIDTLFDRPQPPARWLTRQEMGLPEDKNLYVCPMSIQKIHPDFDDILAGILAKDGKAVIVLFNDFKLQSASARMQSRILAKCAKERVLFLGWQPVETLFSIMKTADAVLVTIHFGAGTTAQYAFAFGIPMVSMPGDHTRSRVVHSYYSILGIEDPPTASTPEDYVEKAVRLANDSAYKARISKEILERNAAMFEDSGYGKRVVRMMKDIIAQTLEDYL